MCVFGRGRVFRSWWIKNKSPFKPGVGPNTASYKLCFSFLTEIPSLWFLFSFIFFQSSSHMSHTVNQTFTCELMNFESPPEFKVNEWNDSWNLLTLKKNIFFWTKHTHAHARANGHRRICLRSACVFRTSCLLGLIAETAFFPFFFLKSNGFNSKASLGKTVAFPAWLFICKCCPQRRNRGQRNPYRSPLWLSKNFF